MTIAEDLWLRGQAAQQNMLHIAKYNTAFLGTAALQGMKLGLTAPMGFWAAMERASAAPARPVAKATPAAKAKPAARRKAAEVVKLSPSETPVAAAPAPASARAAPKAPAGAAPEAAAKPKTKAKAKTEIEAPKPAPAAEPERSGPKPHLLDAPRAGKPDDLTVLAGVGKKLSNALNEFGIYHFDQIAALDEEGIAWLDAQQKGFRMICGRYDLVGQAKALS